MCDELIHIDDAVLDMAVSPQGDLIATASRKGTVRLWKMEGGRWTEQYRLVLPSPVTNISFSSVGDDRFLIMTNGVTVRRWQINEGAFVSSQELLSVACERVGRELADEEYNEFVTEIDTTSLNFVEGESAPSGQICSDP